MKPSFVSDFSLENARPDHAHSQWGRAILNGLTAYLASTLIVLLGASFGMTYIPAQAPAGYRFDYHGEVFANWDGQWYKSIAEQGYFFDPTRLSSIAFFPLFPLLGRLLARILGIGSDYALVMIANASAASAFVVLRRYAGLRYGDDRTANGLVVALGLAPTSVFFRMAYSEGLFLLLFALLLYGTLQNWRPAVLGLVAGASICTRGVGVALAMALVVHLFRRGRTWRGFAKNLCCAGPGALLGPALFLIHQLHAFHDPCAFIKAHEAWSMRSPESWPHRLVNTILLEPVWSVYLSSSPGYWGRNDQNAFFSLRAGNPVYFVAACALLIVGIRRKWLLAEEATAGVLLLIIPYVTIGYSQYLRSAGRHAVIAIPSFLVLARWLSRSPKWLASLAGGLAATFLAIYSALFVAWHRIL